MGKVWRWCWNFASANSQGNRSTPKWSEKQWSIFAWGISEKVWKGMPTIIKYYFHSFVIFYPNSWSCISEPHLDMMSANVSFKIQRTSSGFASQPYVFLPGQVQPVWILWSPSRIPDGRNDSWCGQKKKTDMSRDPGGYWEDRPRHWD